MTAGSSPMLLALAEAEAAAARGEVPVGAVLVDNVGRLLAAAGNRVEADRDPTAHAEMLVLRAAVLRLSTKHLAECDLYVTLEHGPHLFDQPTTHHRPEIYGGIEERRAADLLRAFFRDRRYPAHSPQTKRIS